MIVVSYGLDAITTEKQYKFLSQYLRSSLRVADVEYLLRNMAGMEQYFFFHNDKPVSVISFVRKGVLHCTGTHYRNTLYNVATAPYYRKRGYMRKLLTFVIQRKMAQRFKTLHLEVLKDNKKALRLYRSLGFEVIHECPAIYVMRLRLR